jgi:hypothetical protein
MNSGFTNEAKEILVQLKRNLPLALSTTIAVSLIVAFWKRLLLFAKRRLGLAQPSKPTTLHATLPEGEIARIHIISEVRSGLSIKPGWRGAVIDAGAVQRELPSGRYRRSAISKMIEQHDLHDQARIVVWRDREFPIVLFLSELFTSDHHSMQLIIGGVFNLNPARLPYTSLEEIAQPPEKIAEGISEKIALSARQWVGSNNAEQVYKNRGAHLEGAQLASAWIKTLLQGSPFDLIRVTEFRLANPVLDQIYKEYGETALDNEKAKREIERNQVRGALRQATLAGKLAELRDQQQYEDAVRALEQEKALKEKALKLELAQADFDELEKKARIWKSKRDVLFQAMGAPQLDSGASFEGSRNLTENLRHGILDSPNSPYSAQERTQIRELLQACQARSAEPSEILAAVVKGSDIPNAVLDPVARLRGDHTLRVGDGWRIFDGENLWQVRLTRISTRRHGFLWHHESPALACFEMRGSPGNRRLEQEIPLKGNFRLKAGRNEIPAEYLGGSQSRISLRIS